MTSQLDIYNLALDAVGTRSTVSSLTERSAESSACNRQYNASRIAALSAFHWGFARKQVALPLLASSYLGQSVPVPWIFEYATPSDFLDSWFLMPPTGTFNARGMPTWPPVSYIISTDADAYGNDVSVILTNQEDAILVYTKDLTDIALFDPQFIDALRLLLASRIALPLTGDKGTAQGLFKQYQQAIHDAEVGSGNNSLTINDVTPDWLTARGLASDPEFYGQVS